VDGPGAGQGTGGPGMAMRCDYPARRTQRRPERDFADRAPGSDRFLGKGPSGGAGFGLSPLRDQARR